MTFPAYGKLLLESYGEQPQPAVERSDMESGPAKQRRRQSKRMVQRPYSVIYTSAEFVSFKAWHVNTVNLGADWDSWEDPADGVTKQVRIVGGDYSAKVSPGNPGDAISWQVDMVLETLE